MAIVGVALLALFTVAAAALIVRDPEASLPRSVRQTENGIEILNAKGETMPRWDEIISRHIGFKPVPTTGVNMPEQIQAVVLPAEGGKPAALAIAACQPRDASSCSINLLDPSTGAPLASLKAPVLSDGRPVPLRTTGFTGSYPPNHFRIMALQAAELDGNPSGKELLVVLYHSAEYPSQVLYLRNSHSSASGNGGLEILLNYWSFGWIEPQIVPDSDGDGADEVFLYGTYNGENAAIVTLLPPATGSATVLGRSPDGRRPLKIEAAEDHPVRGFSVFFPKTELAHPQVSEQWSVRSEAVSLLLDRAAGIMTVGVADAAHGETSVRLNLAFTLKMNPGEVRVDFLNYDLYMLYLRRAIGSGRLEDRWGIMKSETLDAYGSDLAGRLLCWDDRDPSPRWKPLDLSRLRERLLARAPIRP